MKQGNLLREFSFYRNFFADGIFSFRENYPVSYSAILGANQGIGVGNKPLGNPAEAAFTGPGKFPVELFATSRL